MSESPETFVCANCGGTFPVGDVEQDRAQFQALFPEDDLADSVGVCDTCFPLLLARGDPASPA